MKIWTFAEAKQKVQEDMDTEEETFIKDSEYVSLFNEAIDDAEAKIHTMNQDYFLASSTISFVDGTSQYDMPTNIYANKIRFIQYSKGTRRYKLERVKLAQIEDIVRYYTNEWYWYNIENQNGVDGPKIIIYPTPNFSHTDTLKLYYLRNANRVEVATDNIDIPEFINYIFAFVKWKIAFKELSPALNSYIEAKDRQEVIMKATLDQMVPDEDETIDPDFSHYNEFYDLSWEYD